MVIDPPVNWQTSIASGEHLPPVTPCQWYHDASALLATVPHCARLASFLFHLAIGMRIAMCRVRVRLKANR